MSLEAFTFNLVPQCDMSAPLSVVNESAFQYGLSELPQRLHSISGSMRLESHAQHESFETESVFEYGMNLAPPVLYTQLVAQCDMSAPAALRLNVCSNMY